MSSATAGTGLRGWKPRAALGWRPARPPLTAGRRPSAPPHSGSVTGTVVEAGQATGAGVQKRAKTSFVSFIIRATRLPSLSPSVLGGPRAAAGEALGEPGAPGPVRLGPIVLRLSFR